MDVQELVEQLQGHTIVAQSDGNGIFGSYFVAWNGSSTYRIFHIYNMGNSVEEVDVWTSDANKCGYEVFPCWSQQRYAQERLEQWMNRE